MISLLNTFIYRIIVVKLDKTKASFLSGIFFGQPSYFNYVSKLCKICSQVIIFHIFFKSTNKHLFDRYSGLGFSKLFPWSSSFCFNRFSIYCVWTSILASIYLIFLCKSNKPEAS